MRGANGVVPPDRHRLPNGGTVDKAETFGWVTVDKRGRYRSVPKEHLRADHAYQRTHVNWARVNRIAARWSWVRFVALAVSERPDGSLWVVDGQHRKLAADKRSDIADLPCVVFATDGPVAEARMFLDINRDRGAVRAIDAFAALTAGGDPAAVAVRGMVEADGYVIGRANTGRQTRCVSRLLRAYDDFGERTVRVAWGLSVRLADGDPVTDDLFAPLAHLEHALVRRGDPSLESPGLADALVRAGATRVRDAARASRVYHNSASPLTSADGVLNLLNKGRRKRLAPVSVRGAAEVEDDD